MKGVFYTECRDPQGQLRWSNTFNNLVMTAGKNALLNNNFEGNAYTAASYIGLISSYGFVAITGDDSMAVKNWREAGVENAPTYEGPRKTATWAGASNGSKTLSSPVTFLITSDGNLKGAFLVFNPGASSAIDSSNGTLYSAGLFGGGEKICYADDVISVNYIANL